jgi:hypothetical protein
LEFDALFRALALGLAGVLVVLVVLYRSGRLPAGRHTQRSSGVAGDD